jgi:hypothetical protein
MMLSDIARTAITMNEQYGINVMPISGKIPRIKWKPYQTERMSKRFVEWTFGLCGITGLAIIHGDVSNNIVIRDFDDDKAYLKWKKKYGDEKYPLVKSRRGYHVYFKGPSMFLKFTDGEYRGTCRQYTLMPPSLHPKGGEYKWLKHLSKGIPIIEDPVEAGMTISALRKSVIASKSTVTVNSNTVDTLYSHSVHTFQTFNESILPTAKRQSWMIPEEIYTLARLHQPKREGTRHHMLFHYVRVLQSTDTRWDTYKLRQAFNLWWEHAERVVATKDVFVSLRDFYDGWMRCHTPAQSLDCDRLIDSADTVVMSDKVCNQCPKGLHLLLRCCYTLQMITGGESFFLSQEDAGRLMGRSRYRSLEAFRRMQQSGLIERLDKGSNLTGKASTYRCLFDF